MSWNLEEAIAYYQKQGAPADQSALISLLREVQQESGGSIPQSMLTVIAESCRIKETLLLAIIKRIPSLRLANTHCLEICAGPNCSRRAALAEFVEKTKKPETLTVKDMPCMRMCGKGPNIRWDGKVYHQADEALLRRLMDNI